METLNPASLSGNSNWFLPQITKNSRWTKEENKRFESALAVFDEKTPDRWLRVAAMIPGKSVSEVINQYDVLVADISNIEAGLIHDVPGYNPPSFSFDFSENHGYETCRKRGRSFNQERKKGIPWTEEEHRFLMGLEAHGKGDWRHISRNFVISKTPTQVASHAQKYFLRQITSDKDKKKPSIHDITTLNLIRGNPFSSDDDPEYKSPSLSKCNFKNFTNSSKGLLFDWNDSVDDGFSTVFDSIKCNESMGSSAHRYLVL